jgi:RND family efflux transporter MFP subunit
VVGLVLLTTLGAAAWSGIQQYRAAASVPAASVARGAFVDEVTLRGEVRPLRSRVATAPALAGDLRIVSLVKNGSSVRRGDVIAQFDPATLQRTLEEKRSELRQAEGEIDKVRGETRLREEQDATDLTKARYDVERARLDVSTEDLISRVEADKFRLDLADAERRLKEIDSRLGANRRGAAADLDSRRQKRDKAAAEVAKAESDLLVLTLRAPDDGTVTLLDNWRAGGPMMGGTREFREGDRAWSGAGIAEVPDLSTVEVVVKVDEADRSRLGEGQSAVVRVDALPDRELQATVLAISTLAKVVFEGWPPTKQFEMRLRLVQPDARLRSGMSATARVAVERLEAVLVIPTKAVFQKGGRAVAYVRAGRSWQERFVTVNRRNVEQVVVTGGVAEGDRVALRDPTLPVEGGTR